MSRRFQNIHLALTLLFLLVWTPCPTLAESDYDDDAIFGPDFEITLNQDFIEFDNEMKTLNHLSFIYVFDSELQRSMQMTD